MCGFEAHRGYMEKKQLLLTIESAKKIIRDRNCEKINDCYYCPFYFQYKNRNCETVLGHFISNPQKIVWFREWLIKIEQKQLEFNF